MYCLDVYSPPTTHNTNGRNPRHCPNPPKNMYPIDECTRLGYNQFIAAQDLPLAPSTPSPTTQPNHDGHCPSPNSGYPTMDPSDIMYG